MTLSLTEDTPDAVFKAVVGRSGEDKVGPSQLLDVSQSLELRCVNDSDEKWVQHHMPVDRIIKDLAGDKTTKERLTPSLLLTALVCHIETICNKVKG